MRERTTSCDYNHSSFSRKILLKLYGEWKQDDALHKRINDFLFLKIAQAGSYPLGIQMQTDDFLLK